MLREGDQRVIREVIPVVIRGVFTRAGEHDRAEELLVITLDALAHVAQLCMHVALACFGVERVPVGTGWAPW